MRSFRSGRELSVGPQAPEGIVAALTEKFRTEKVSIKKDVDDGFDAEDYGCGKAKIKKRKTNNVFIN